MNQDWSWWQNALNGVKQPVHDGDPKSGFYRIRDGKGGPWVPVAIWQDDASQWVALRNGTLIAQTTATPVRNFFPSELAA